MEKPPEITLLSFSKRTKKKEKEKETVLIIKAYQILGHERNLIGDLKGCLTEGNERVNYIFALIGILIFHFYSVI
jgi:hypothetical protein